MMVVREEVLAKECNYCHGSEKVKCPTCGGRKQVLLDIAGRAVLVECLNCEGTGEIECPYCGD